METKLRSLMKVLFKIIFNCIPIITCNAGFMEPNPNQTKKMISLEIYTEKGL